MPTTRKVVWSSDPDARDKLASAGPTATPAHKPAQQVARLVRDRKGRGGKTVTLIEGLTLSAEDYETLARDLRRMCGTGGTVKGTTIEIQGDQRERIAALLQERGYKVKLVGG